MSSRAPLTTFRRSRRPHWGCQFTSATEDTADVQRACLVSAAGDPKPTLHANECDFPVGIVCCAAVRRKCLQIGFQEKGRSLRTDNVGLAAHQPNSISTLSSAMARRGSKLLSPSHLILATTEFKGTRRSSITCTAGVSPKCNSSTIHEWHRLFQDFPIAVFPGDLAVAKNEKVTPADFNPNACSRRSAAQRPLRDPGIACDDVLIIAVVYIRDASKPRLKSFSHSSCADESDCPRDGSPGASHTHSPLRRSSSRHRGRGR